MARTLPYGICDRHGPAASAIAPLPHSPPLSPSPSADKRKLSPRRARNFARNLPPGLEQRVTVLEKLIIFCTQAEGERARGVGGRFMQSVSSTLNNDFYRCPCRRRAAMPSGQVYELFYHSTPRNLLLFRCRHRSSTLRLLSQSYAGSLSCYTV